MCRVYVGNLQPYIAERDLKNVFQIFGQLRSVWVAQSPRGTGYAFVEFDDRRDALDAIAELDGRNGWRVELSQDSRRFRASSEDLSSFEYGDRGHFARDCQLCQPCGLGYRRRYRTPSPEYYQGLKNYRSRSSSPPRRSQQNHRSGFRSGISNSTYRRSSGCQRDSRSPISHGN